MVLPLYKGSFNFVRRISLGEVLRTNHYTALGLTPSASQAEIKKAYYELSKVHHPDRNDGSEKSAQTFRAITAAYEILGNEKSRNKYDKQNVAHASTSASFNDEDVMKSRFEGGVKRYKRRQHTGRTSYFNFDAWNKAHYEYFTHPRARAKPPLVEVEESEPRRHIKTVINYLFITLFGFILVDYMLRNGTHKNKLVNEKNRRASTWRNTQKSNSNDSKTD